MNDIQDRIKTIKTENYIWIIYIIIILLSWYANSKEIKYILFNDEKSKKQYQNLLIFIFTILVIIYLYFTKEGYDDINKLSIYDSNKKVVLTYASYIGSVLILISGIIFLIIAITDDNIDTEIAFN